jgi:hypothetical protein
LVLDTAVCVGHARHDKRGKHSLCIEWKRSPTAITSLRNEKAKYLEHPPQRHVRKKLESFIRTNRLHLEWIALGRTAKSFWTAAKRLISRLESVARFRGSGQNFAPLD